MEFIKIWHFSLAGGLFQDNLTDYVIIEVSSKLSCQVDPVMISNGKISANVMLWRFDMFGCPWLIDWLIDWLTAWLIYCLVDRSIEWLINWLIECLVDRLIDWLID